MSPELLPDVYRQERAPSCLRPADTRWARALAQLWVWGQRHSGERMGWLILWTATFVEMWWLTTNLSLLWVAVPITGAKIASLLMLFRNPSPPDPASEGPNPHD